VDKWGRKWQSPVMQNYRDPNSKAIVDTASSLTEYFNSTVGVWFEYEGTTDADGSLFIPHGAPFIPSAAFIQLRHVSGSTHDLGAWHVESLDDTIVEVHFLKANNGNDASNHFRRVYVMVLP